MGRQTRLLIGISIFWLALSVLFDGVNTRVLPLQLSALSGQNEAVLLGLFAFVRGGAGFSCQHAIDQVYRDGGNGKGS